MYIIYRYMKILSIDVGIKNLAYCMFEDVDEDGSFKITKWDISNIAEQEEDLTCIFIDKNVLCKKPAKFKKNDECYCLKHSQKTQHKLPPKTHTKTLINKPKIKQLYEIADDYKIQYDKTIKKPKLIDLISDHIKSEYLLPIEHKNATDISLFNIGLNIQTKFNRLFQNETIIDYVIIENQIGPLAIRMKTIQGMLVQYFIMSNLIVKDIKFISSANKLKNFNITEKSTYKERKLFGIAKTLELISINPHFSEHIEHFNSHKKKDDLADSFLQGIWFIKNKI